MPHCLTPRRLDILDPIFPIEVTEMILGNVKMQKDLANCSRVNKHFKKRCQPALYHHLRISCGAPRTAPDDYISGYVLSESSKLLFRTLEGNKVLRQYPRKLTLDADGDAEQEWIVDDDGEEGDSEVEERDESRGHYEFNSEFEDPSEPFERCLRLLPKIDAVDLDRPVWWWRPFRDVVFNHGERWKEIKVSGELLTEEGDERDLRVLSRLEKLECERIGETDLDDQYLPSRLRTLDARDCSLPAGDPSVDSQLHKVLTALTAETITYLPSYQNLQRLHLYQNWDDLEPPLPDVLPGFQSLPALHFLCLSLDKLSPSFAAATAALLAHLPPSLSRLEFLDIIPFDILAHFVQHRSGTTSLAMGFKEDAVRQEGCKEEFEHLAILCQEKGVEIYLLPRSSYSWCMSSHYEPSIPSFD